MTTAAWVFRDVLPEEWMALLLFCITIMRAPTMPSESPGGGGGRSLVLAWGTEMSMRGSVWEDEYERMSSFKFRNVNVSSKGTSELVMLHYGCRWWCLLMLIFLPNACWDTDYWLTLTDRFWMSMDGRSPCVKHSQGGFGELFELQPMREGPKRSTVS